MAHDRTDNIPQTVLQAQTIVTQTMIDAGLEVINSLPRDDCGPIITTDALVSVFVAMQEAQPGFRRTA